MYEAQTYEVILARMLQKALSVNSNLDTREGSLVWLGNAPAAVELQNLYIRQPSPRKKNTNGVMEAKRHGKSHGRLEGLLFRFLLKVEALPIPEPPKAPLGPTMIPGK